MSTNPEYTMLRSLPNMLTIFRILAVIPLVYWLLNGEYFYALMLAVIAGFTDLLDGLLARKFDWTSRFGRILDPLADKLMLVSLTLVLAYIGEFPMWLAVLVLLRDIVIVIGGVSYQRWVGPVEVSPFRLSKWNTALQILLVLFVMLRLNMFSLQFAGVEFVALTEHVLIWVVAITTAMSGSQYVLVWGGRARRELAKKSKQSKTAEKQ